MNHRYILCCLLVCATSPRAHAKPVNTLVHVYRSETLCWLEKTKVPLTVSSLSTMKTCPNDNIFNPATDIFRTGEVVRLLVIGQPFRTGFAITLSSVPIASNLPDIRGISNVTPVADKPAEPAPAVKGPGGTAAKSVQELQTINQADIEAALRTVFERAIATLEPAEYALIDLVGDEQSTTDSPRLQLKGIRLFAEELRKRTKTEADLKESTDEALFEEFLQGTDGLIFSIQSLNSNLQYLGVNGLANEALKASDAFFNQGDEYRNVPTPNESLKKYLPSGKLYIDLAARTIKLRESTKAFRDHIRQINLLLLLLFGDMNEIYDQSKSKEPFQVFSRNWTENTTVEMRLNAERRYMRYGLAAALTSAAVQSSAGQSAEIQTGAAKVIVPGVTSAKEQAAGATPKTSDPKPAEAKPNAASNATSDYVFTKSFDVHRFYVANVVAGFAASTLRNNEYSVNQQRTLDDNGNPLTNSGVPVFHPAAVVGDSTRPQVHYYAGVNFYFKPQDTFPLKNRKLFTPGIMFAYGLNDPMNFFIGPNIETKIGLNFGAGWHIGRERFLAAGIENGSRLPADTKEAPTTLRTNWKAAYVNVGFDIAVVKSVWGTLFNK